jgi:hypothetical protein
MPAKAKTTISVTGGLAATLGTRGVIATGEKGIIETGGMLAEARAMVIMNRAIIEAGWCWLAKDNGTFHLVQKWESKSSDHQRETKS